MQIDILLYLFIWSQTLIRLIIGSFDKILVLWSGHILCFEIYVKGLTFFEIFEVILRRMTIHSMHFIGWKLLTIFNIENMAISGLFLILIKDKT